ncbi:hypothetical protein AaE_004473 [Aphanomyces astaci]|uniref:Class I SAM-dependent methyltransferase n=1 Tax=Aphanomyces astaci TaxID=112090 RepID=A0A6A5AID3_APHAT|nr:hypothetical protein AaE_004473 [Aphanomyces astaci]
MTILTTNPTLHLISFDLVEHPYTPKAAAFLDAVFPGRHKLIPGDSTKTVPEALEDADAGQYDFMFIDGGHTYDVAAADLRNCMRLSRAGTLVVMDDVVGTSTSWWTKGPTQAWNEAMRSGVVVELGRIESSRGSPTPYWIQTSRPSVDSKDAPITSGVDGLAFGFYTGSAKILVDSLLQQT